MTADKCPTCGSGFYAIRRQSVGAGDPCMDKWHTETELETARQRAVPEIDREKTFYLAGPMTGYPEYNYPVFEDAQRALENSGLKIASPHTLPWPEGDVAEEKLWSLMMEASERMMRYCDGIILLKGWPQSRGARKELQLALTQGWPVYYYNDFELRDMNKEGIN